MNTLAVLEVVRPVVILNDQPASESCAERFVSINEPRNGARRLDPTHMNLDFCRPVEAHFIQ